jgi:3-oxoacyl-[acyl-carrier-protein] synthase-3
MQLSIDRIGVALGSTVVTNEDLAREHPEWDLAAITEKTGTVRRFTSPSESALDLSVSAATQILAESDKSSIDCVLAVTSTADLRFPGIACLVQHKLGLQPSVFAFDINLGCSGFVYGYITLAALALAKVVRRPLLVCADTYARFIASDDRAARPIFSDAATATLFSLAPGMTIIDYEVGTDGSGAFDLMLKASTHRGTDGKSASPAPDLLHMDGAKVLMFTMSKVPASVRKLLSRQGLKIDDIDHFVFHQASRIVLDNLQRTLKIPESRVFRNLEQFGNTVACTIPICLKTLIEKAALRPGSRILLCGFGVGLSWATCLIRVDKAA